MDNKKILESVKLKIAISNNKEEDIVMKNGNGKFRKSIGLVAGIILSTTVITTTGVALTKKYTNKFGDNASQGVQIAVDNNYIETVNTEYQSSAGIDISVDSFLIDDSNFDIIFDIKFDDNYNVNEMLGLQLLDLRVIDETGKTVFATTEAEAKMDNLEELYKNAEDSMNNYKLYFGGYGGDNKIIGEHQIKNYVNATGNPVNFPRSRKLIVTFSKIKITKYMINPEDISKNPIYTGKWNFELDVPENMYNRELIFYKVKNINSGNYVVDKAQLSNTAFKIYISKADGLAMANDEYVETSDGRKFYSAQRNDGDGGLSVDSDGNVKYYKTFNLTKFDTTDNLKVHLFKDDGQEVIIELDRL